jgi:DNA-binding CsgD family transcriptional regulator
MKSFLPNSYLELLEDVGNYHQFPKPGADELLQNMGFKGVSFNKISPIFYAGDYTQGKYLYIDPSCRAVLGYEVEHIAQEGPMYFVSLWHPADFKIYNEIIFPETIRFLKKQHPGERLNFSSSINYRIMASNGRYITVLQRSTCYLHPDTGKPLAVVGFIIDITHYKEDSSIIHTIEKIDGNFSVLSKEPVYKAVYYPAKESNVLSKREMEILQLIYQGLGSKEIAIKLFVSINTVNNHRKNMLQKSGCKNSSELLNYAAKNGLV